MGKRQNDYVKRAWVELIASFGGMCEFCGSFIDLEFAHVKRTDCVGEGRGKSRRLYDIRKHQDRYKLLCMHCHDDFDGRKRRCRQVERRSEHR